MGRLRLNHHFRGFSNRQKHSRLKTNYLDLSRWRATSLLIFSDICSGNVSRSLKKHTKHSVWYQYRLQVK